MSAAWSKVKLGEVLGLSDTSVPSSELGEVNLAGVYSFGRGLFARGPMLPSNTSYRSYNRLVVDDFVISQPKAWEGALARVTRDFDGWYLSPVFSTFRADSARLEPAFLDWFCKRKAVWTELQRNSRGIGARRETVSPETFLTLQISLPPLAEQRRIVARVEELAAQIDEAKALRKQAAMETEALMTCASAQAYDRAAAAAGMKRLDDLCRQITDGTHSTPRYIPEGVPFLSVKDITSGIISFADTRHISAEEHAELARRCKPEQGDILLTKVGTTGFAKAIDVDREFSIFVSLALLKPKPDRLDPRFAEFMLNSSRLRQHSAAGTRGVGNKNLVLKFIREFPMPAPPLPDQRRIVAELDALQAEVDALKRLQAETAAELDALLPSILDKAFKGEL